ncbi:MAG TPA: hypothetical protein VEZ88_05750 [Steroidobacteraceae bacterium]|nr:hypothetical protein [Steroidobacteraceae bacterium]
MRPSTFFRNIAFGLAMTLSMAATFASDDKDKDDEDADEAVPLESLPHYLQDRRGGVPTSLASTYVREGELLLSLQFLYNRDNEFEYDPNEFGFTSPGEFKGNYWDSSADVLVAFGLSNDLVLELEAAATRASLKKADEDLSGMPNELKESGLGDVRTRLDWRVLEETEHRPEVFTYVGALIPHDKSKQLIGTGDWLGIAGAGVVRGYDWGTMTFRMGVEYDFGSASEIDWGEVAVEYLKRLSPIMTVYGAVAVLEGDEYSLVGELQWHLSPNVVLKLNSGVGLTSHGMDWSPKIGVLFNFPD